jgi:hypothetical protein
MDSKKILAFPGILFPKLMHLKVTFSLTIIFALIYKHSNRNGWIRKKQIESNQGQQILQVIIINACQQAYIKCIYVIAWFLIEKHQHHSLTFNTAGTSDSTLQRQTCADHSKGKGKMGPAWICTWYKYY